MKIVNVNKRDTGNQCYKLSKAINQWFPDTHVSRAFVDSQGYTQFPYDIMMKDEWRNGRFPEWIVRYWEEADIVHRHGFWRWGLGWAKPRHNVGKILHQHGRWGAHVKLADVEEEDKKYNQLRVVSTLNLLPWVRNNPKRWFPPPIDIEFVDKIKAEYVEKKSDNIIISHSPTHRGRKHTELFIRTMKEIRKKYANVQVMLVENVTHEECLKLRVKADIHFDQLLLQHGTSGLEAMTMRQAVIAGCGNRTWDTILEVVGAPPFIKTTSKTLFKVIEKLIMEPEFRSYMGSVGRRYIEEYHSFKYTAELAIKTYEELL